MLISSPNRDRYVPGNPHHNYEFVPEELKTALGGRYENVRLLRQHDCVASVILEDDALAESGTAPVEGIEVRKLVGHEPGTETYTLAIASDGELPASLMPLTLTHSIELRQWMEHFASQDRLLREQMDYLRGSRPWTRNGATSAGAWSRLRSSWPAFRIWSSPSQPRSAGSSTTSACLKEALKHSRM